MDKYGRGPVGWDRERSNSGMEFTETGYTTYCKRPGYFNSAIGRLAMRAGKRYRFTLRVKKRSLHGLFQVGICLPQNLENASFAASSKGWAFYPCWSGCKVNNGVMLQYGKSLSRTGLIDVEVDLVEGALSFALNGEALGPAFRIPVDQPLYPAFATSDPGITCSFLVDYWRERRIFLFLSRRTKSLKKIPQSLLREIVTLIA